MSQLANQIAVVTGAGRGIGRAIALKFANEGADVVVVSRTQENSEKVAAEIRALGRKAWAHAVDIDGAKLHYHKRSTELYYVLDGGGTIILDGVAHEISRGSLIHIPPHVVHGARGRMRVLVIGIPDIADDDYYEVQNA